MPGRLIAISDIHGCLAALEAVLAMVQPQPDDTLVTLGDYVDRGPDSSGVIEALIALAKQTRLVPLMGNHDEMMLNVCGGRHDLFTDWLLFGGNATLKSYHTLRPEVVTPEHLYFLRQCRPYHETERHFFVHGNYLAELPLSQQPSVVLMWESLKKRRPGPHFSGKIAIMGHTAQKNGEILDLGYLRCIDTWCYGDGYLTAHEVNTGQTWQADKNGRARKR